MDTSRSSWPHSPTTPPVNHLPPTDPHKDRQKKPRHRHSPAQLAALNELYDRNEHPPLDLRTSLAERLGMETKTVNAWFQNKRASSKKRTRGGVPYDLPPISSLMGSNPSSTSNTPRQPEFDDFPEDEYSPLDRHNSRSASHVVPSENSRPLSSFYAGNPDHTHFLAETDAMPRRMRMRPTAEQTDELRKLYNVNPHPTTEQRQILSERIGMRYQSITNWFQNQRSLAKKRKEDEADAVAVAPSSRDFPHENRTFSAFPPPSGHPSLSLPPPASHPSLGLHSRIRRSPSVTPSVGDEPSSRRSMPRRSVTPYGSGITSLSRPRRTRPEPYQLDALKDLFTKTSNPSIEERTALALEIGMDIGKVTNWFRNLRQTARKRAKKLGSGDDDDDDSYSGHNIYSTSVSRSGTPSLRSSSSSNNDADDSMDMDREDYDMHGAHSDIGSDDDYQEAVTPSPEPSPSPPPSIPSHVHVGLGMVVDPVAYAELEKASAARFSGIKIEDALLLLSFHQHIVH